MGERVAIVMAGGSGERFWPLSRPDRPKQLLKLTHETLTMLEEAAERIAPVVAEGQVYVSTSAAIADAVTASGSVPKEKVLAEPTRRNTLGALCWVAAKLIAQGLGEATVAVVTADHMIGDPALFCATVETAFEIAEREQGLVTIGVRPDRPETGYGYIEFDADQTVGSSSGRLGYRSKGFREKPSTETAVAFLSAGTFLWNAGMFFYTIPTFVSELRTVLPEAAAVIDDMVTALKAGDEREATVAFERLPSISIDYALMEKAQRVFVVPAEFPWDDVGAWDALDRTFPKDERGNVCQGTSVLLDTSDCVVVNEAGGTTVGMIGVQNLIVVNTHHAVLVCPKERAQEVRNIVRALSGSA